MNGVGALPVDASGEGWRIDGILHFANYAAIVLGFVAMTWLAIALIRDRKHKKATYTHGTGRREKMLPLALAALVFFGVDGYLLYRSTTDLNTSILRVDEALLSPGALRVQIGARQWAWDVRYPGLDNTFGTNDDIYTVSQLVVPKGRAVVFELASGDVVHSFYLPNFRIKQDAIPGSLGRGWFRAEKLGSYEIACAQHCGVHHYQMRGIVDVLSDENYEAWRSAMSADSVRVSKEDARALEEEPSRSPIGEPVLEEAPTRDWWAWGGRPERVE